MKTRLYIFADNVELVKKKSLGWVSLIVYYVKIVESSSIQRVLQRRITKGVA